MTDKTPANLTRKEAQAVREWAERAWRTKVQDAVVAHAARVLLAVLPPRPTMADMTEEERRACQWMQADVKSRGRVVIIVSDLRAGRAALLDRWGDVAYEDHDTITPRPDLPRMTWPGDTEVEDVPAPALPDGWRLADHQKHGRVIVTNTTPDDDGEVCLTFPINNLQGYDWDTCTPDELTYIDSPTTKEVGTPTGPGHLAVGTVIESADDPRIAALPVGSILLDRDEDATIKGRGEWTGAGYIPIPSEYGMFAPWTVLHIPKEKA